MKAKKFRCPEDNTLLMTIVEDGEKQGLQAPKGGGKLDSADVPGKPGWIALSVVCPQCGKTKFIGTMPKP